MFVFSLFHQHLKKHPRRLHVCLPLLWPSQDFQNHEGYECLSTPLHKRYSRRLQGRSCMLLLKMIKRSADVCRRSSRSSSKTSNIRSPYFISFCLYLGSDFGKLQNYRLSFYVCLFLWLKRLQESSMVEAVCFYSKPQDTIICLSSFF
jgi:hypothetical protein